MYAKIKNLNNILLLYLQAALSLSLFFSLQLYHKASTLSSDDLIRILGQTDVDRMWKNDLKPMLVVRYPGSPGSQAVQQVGVKITWQCMI